MERTVLLVRPEQRSKLVHLAALEKVSVAEINRRAIDAYSPFDAEAENLQELEKLADFLIASTARATQALKEAHKEVQETLTYFATQRRNHKNECQQQDI